MNSKSISTAMILIIGLSSMTFAQRVLAETSFEAENVTSIQIKGRFCNVMIEKGSRNYVEGKILGSGDPDDYRFDMDISGGRLVLTVESRSNSWNNTRESEIMVTVADIDELLVNNSSGNVEANDIKAEFIELESTSGNIEAEGLVAQRINLGSTSGNVYAEDLKGDVRAKSTSGNLEVKQVKGESGLRTTSGNLRLRYFEGMTSVESTSGNITVANGKGLEYAKTTSGDIDGYDLMLDISLTLRSTSGDIELELMNDFDELSFDLRSNSGDLMAGRYDGEDELYIKNGEIWIKGSTTSGDLEIR